MRRSMKATILAQRGGSNRPAQRRRPKRRRRSIPPAKLRTNLRYGALAALLAVLVAIPVWWWHSGGMARAWDAMARAVTREVVDATRAAGLVVDEVYVEGRRRTATRSLKRALSVDRGHAILTIDLDAAKARLEALPWVRFAAVERRLPGTIFVRLKERAPLALWQLDGKFSLIDPAGAVILKRPGQAYRKLPLVVGAGAAEHAAELIDLLATQPQLRKRVKASVRVGDRRWNLRLSNGVEVKLPERNPEAALQRLAAAERQHGLLDRDVIAVDLRFADRLILRTGSPARPRLKPRRNGVIEKST